MFQRAYFDFLKDYAHLSEGFTDFSPIIRFAMPDFEIENHNPFLKISDNDVQKIIEQRLMK
jgi:hypothetical protein